jgi:eukaryotic-like serine/threonine-protein kinase
VIGQTIAHYRITAKLGEGGMGAVYLATDERLERQVALKFLPDQLSLDPQACERLRQEAKAVSRLAHPNIVMVHSVEKVGHREFIVMEYVPGQSLAEMIGSGLPLDRVIDIAIQVAEGLKAAHRAEVIHQDLKPSNIMIDDDGRVRILDFGVARICSSVGLTPVDTQQGTVSYMSPEQVRGQAADQRADIFSFGILLYEMIAGRTPFGGEHMTAIMYAIANEEPAALRPKDTDLPPKLSEIIDRCLTKNRDERYQTAGELTDDLIALRRSEGAVGEPKVEPAALPSIAVLPFDNLSAEKDQDYFCDGITEEITNALTHVDGLRVVARTSAFAFKDRKEDIRAIGQALNVGSVVEGSVRKAGSKIRITAQLVNVADGYHIWSERYDREMEDVFTIQDEITLAVVDKLKVTLLAGEKASVVKRYTDDLEAYRLYLKGRYYWNRRFEGALPKAIECCQHAIARDPLYATAYTGIADSYMSLGYFGYLPPRDVFPKGKAAAEKALQIDENLAEAHASLGWIKTVYDWDWQGAASSFQRALELNPQYASTHEWYALYLTITGRFDEAIAETKRAQELDPLSLIINSVAGVVYYMARRYDEGIDQLNRAIEMDPAFALSYWFLAGNFMERGELDKAIAALLKLEALTPDGPLAPGALGTAYAMAGQSKQAADMLHRLEEMHRKRYVSPFHFASIYMGLGQRDEAFKQLDAAVEVRESLLAYSKVWPWFDPLRSDQRFGVLLGKLGLGG